jgi:hypothetical protein
MCVCVYKRCLKVLPYVCHCGYCIHEKVPPYGSNLYSLLGIEDVCSIVDGVSMLCVCTF